MIQNYNIAKEFLFVKYRNCNACNIKIVGAIKINNEIKNFKDFSQIIDNLEYGAYNTDIIYKKAMMVRSTYYSYFREKMYGENLYIEDMEAALKL